MVRMSKQSKRRSVSPRRPNRRQKPTGAKVDQLVLGYKEKKNALSGERAMKMFIPKMS